MSQTFYGPWRIDVVSRDADFGERFVIVGSDGSDGVYNGTPGVSVQVAGEAWNLDLQWNDNVGSGWQPSGVRRETMYTVSQGLTVTLGADDNVEALRDHDFNDVVLMCHSTDPALNPLPDAQPLSFTITKEMLRRADGDDRRRRE